MLLYFAHGGIEHLKGSRNRVDKIKKVSHPEWRRLKDFYLMMGQYDGFLAEAHDDESIARIALLIAAQGNRRSETHRALCEAEFRQLVCGLPKDFWVPYEEAPRRCACTVIPRHPPAHLI